MMTPRPFPSADIDYQLLRDGVVTMYWRRWLLADVANELRHLGYSTIEIDAEAVTSITEFLGAIGRALAFPEYFNPNLDGLNDCMHDIATMQTASASISAGTVIVFWSYDRTFEVSQHDAREILDIIAARAYNGLLVGHRIIVLVHTKNPDLSFTGLGGQLSHWNRREWANISRHPDLTPQNSIEEGWLAEAQELDRGH